MVNTLNKLSYTFCLRVSLLYLKTPHLNNSVPFAEAQDSTSGPEAFLPGLGSQFRIFVAQSNVAENFDAQIKDKQKTKQSTRDPHK